MKDFIGFVKAQYFNGNVSRAEAIQSIFHHYRNSISLEQVGDIIDGEVIAAGRRFQSISSMAKLKPSFIPPSRFTNKLCVADEWFGDLPIAEKKLACQLNINDSNFYFCFGRERGVAKSLGEDTELDRWVFKAVIVNKNGVWYIGQFNDSDFEVIADYITKLDFNFDFNDVKSKLRLASSPEAYKILGAFD